MMTHTIRNTLINAILVAVTVLVTLPANAGTITLATHELYPYGYHDSEDNFTGYAVKRVRFAVARCGFKLRLLVLPWARAQAMAKTDSVDGFFAGSLNDERKDLYVPSAVLAPQNWTWYLLRDSSLNPDSPHFKERAKVGSFIGANMLTYPRATVSSFQERPKTRQPCFKCSWANALTPYWSMTLLREKCSMNKALALLSVLKSSKANRSMRFSPNASFARTRIFRVLQHRPHRVRNAPSQLQVRSPHSAIHGQKPSSVRYLSPVFHAIRRVSSICRI